MTASSWSNRFFWAAAATAVFPFFLLNSLTNKSWRAGLEERLRPRGWEDIWRTAGGKTIWLHAASVGEVSGAEPVLEGLQNEGPLIITTTSVTGKEKAEALGFARSAQILPYDHPCCWRSVFRYGGPRLVVITETEIWPNFLFTLRERKIPVVLINARLSNYSFPRYLKFRRFLKPVVETISLVLAQSAADAERFEALGLPAEKVLVTGSSKYDRETPILSAEEKSSLASLYGLDLSRPVFVAGSVREHEDEIVVRAFKDAAQQYPELQLLIAPRHPERFAQTAQLLEQEGLHFNRRSAGAAMERRPVFLLDAMGELSRSYGLGTFAFVGATLVNIGGHNPLEPAAFGLPVLAGPYSTNARDAVQDLKQAGAFFEVTNQEQLAGVLCRLLADQAKRGEAGEAARFVARQNVGATARILDRLKTFL